MPKKPFLPRPVALQGDWLNNFVDKLQDPAKGYAAKYNVALTTIAHLDAGRHGVNWAFENLNGVRDASVKLTGYRDSVMSGASLPTLPTAPIYTTPPATPSSADVIGQATAVGNQIKAASNYDPVDGADLGLEGADITPADPATTHPNLAGTRLGSGGHVEVVWTKAHFDALKLTVDRGDGHGPVFLAIDTVPNYIDTVKPAPGQSAIYTYTGIYMLKDAEFGQWSLPFAMTVRG